MNADLYGMTQDEVLAYLNDLYGGKKLDFTVNNPLDDNGTYWSNTPYGTTADGLPVAQWGQELPWGFEQQGLVANLTPTFDPSYEGGVYGRYVGDYDTDGNLQNIRFEKGERSGSWLEENMDIWGPMLVLGAAGLGYGLGGAGGAGGAGLGAEAAVDFGALSGASGEIAGIGSTGFGAAGTGAAALGDTVTLALDGTGGELVNTGAQLGSESLGTGIGGSALGTGISPGASSYGLGAGALGTGISGSAAALTPSLSSSIIPGISNAALGSAVGGGLGLLNSLTAPKSQTTTTQRTMDPRFDPAVFGENGIMQKWLDVLNRPKTQTLSNVFGIADNFFGG